MTEENSVFRTFAGMFKTARGTGEDPFPYQERLALAESWPDVMIAPTGLGKTAAVLLAWAWARMQHPEQTARRLVYCLPMRTLVTQTTECAQQWLDKLNQSGAENLPDKVHVLMGGMDKESGDQDWVSHPEKPAILVGTQDMLISRALMRGYGLSRFRWPIDFALLQWDAQWVFDEVQLMGAALPTSAQLEAFRRQFAKKQAESVPLPPARSLWISATLDPEWLKTIDFRQEIQEPVTWMWNDAVDGQKAPEPEHLQKRLDARKEVRQAGTRLIKDTDESAPYAEQLTKEILGTHCKGYTTLVIVNTVKRAQYIFTALQKEQQPEKPDCMLLHSRFRPGDRKQIEEKLPRGPEHKNLIIVATQAVEAGVDLTSAVMFTELAPWASLIQRFGRCNRYGEIQEYGDAVIRWIDIDVEAGDALTKPYEENELQAARIRLSELANAAPRKLDDPGDGTEPTHVLRRKDLLELFDTDADLTGYDLDISPYIRDAEDTDLRIFWRKLKTAQPDDLQQQKPPRRDELCAIPIAQARSFLKKVSQAGAKKGGAYVIDPNVQREKRGPVPWKPLTSRDEPRPGLTVMLDERAGGYDPELGFRRDIKAGKVQELNNLPEEEMEKDDASMEACMTDSDHRSVLRSNIFVGLPIHLVHVQDAAEHLCKTLELPDCLHAAIIRAALWHDVGKAHEEFQARMVSDDPGKHPKPNSGKLFAKAPKYDYPHGEIKDRRNFFRHELASALAYLAHHGKTESDNLVAYLIAAHHGKIRMGIRALPNEKHPEGKDTRFARGVWDGDELPALTFGEESIPETSLSLEIMEMGEGNSGPSWSARTQALLNEHGPFKLSLLETLVRLADWRASAQEEKRGEDDV